MSISNEPRLLAVDVRVREHELTVEVTDGRRLSVPLAWYPRLADATPQQRATWELVGDGAGIHWPEIDEDLSVAGIFAGVRVPRRQSPAA